MALSVSKRTEACKQLLRNEFDVDTTVKWVLRTYADEPEFVRATNKDRLARNIVTIGGSGIQQELNLVAFQQALAWHAAEQRRREASVHEQVVEDLKAKLLATENRADEAAGEYRNQVTKVQDLQEKLATTERELLLSKEAEVTVA